MTLPLEFGAWIKRRRKELDLTQSALAHMVPCAVQTVRALESRRLRPSRQLAERLADALQIAADDRELFLALARRTAPPVRTTQSTSGTSHLPNPETPFVGRQRQIAHLAALIGRGKTRLLTLVGPGGVGKTRLAIEVSRRVAGDFPDGAWFVDLTSVREPALVAAQIAQVLGLPELPAGATLPSLAPHLARRHMLLVLDNLEHVRPEAAAVSALLRDAPGLTLLTTSRVAIGAAREQIAAVEPLQLPATRDAVPLEELERYEAISLFLLRAQAVRPDLALDEATRAAITEICRRLDGLPLALELAAARLRLLSPAGLLARLDHPLRLLGGGAHDLPERQQKLRAVMDWSYALLDPAAQALFRRLAVFVDGWTAEAAEAVCDRAGHGEDTLSSIETLLDNSLVQLSARPGVFGDEPRFRMLEIIREYGIERLAEHGEEHAAREAHARYFQSLVARVAPELRGGRQALSLATLDSEYENLRAAFEWLLAAGAGDDALQFAVDMWYYWARRERLNDGCSWLERALERAARQNSWLEGRALAALGDLLFRRGELARAEAVCHHARAHFEALGDQWGGAFVTLVEGHIELHRGNPQRARRLYEQSLSGFRTTGDAFWTSWTLYDLASVLRETDVPRAEALLEESEASFRSQGFEYGIGAVLTARGLLAIARGNLSRARHLLEESLALGRRQGDRTAWHLLLLGEVAAASGDRERARALVAESLADYEQIGVRRGVALAAAALGWIALAGGDRAQAARMLEQGRWVFHELGDDGGIAWCLCGSAWLALAEHDRAYAHRALAESLRHYQRTTRSRGLAECLRGVAVLAADQERHAVAGRLLGASEASWPTAETPLAPVGVSMYEGLQARLGAHLEEAVLQASLAEGRSLAPPQAIAAALEALDELAP